MKSNDRLYNFDVLRIIAMIMIIMLHVLSHSGALLRTVGINNYISYFVEALCCVGVNVFVLLSGYFLIDRDYKSDKIKKLWISTLFYSIVFGLIFFLAGHRFDINDTFKTIFPLISKSYWFITIYVCLYILTPYINVLLNNLSKEQHKKLLQILFVLFSVIPTVTFFAQSIDATRGQGIIWFIVLYITGAYIKKYIKEVNYSARRLLLYYIICSTLIMLSHYIIKFICLRIGYDGAGTYALMYNYNSPLNYVSAILLFLLFYKLKVKKSKFIIVLSSLTFGVYLIHENYFLKQYLYTNILHIDTLLESPFFGVYLIIFVILIFSVGCLFEYIRSYIFNILSRGKGNEK